MIAIALRHYLSSPVLLEAALGTGIERTAMENLLLLADCVYHILVSGKGKFNPFHSNGFPIHIDTISTDLSFFMSPF